MGNPSPQKKSFPLQESSRMGTRKRREALIHRGEGKITWGDLSQKQKMRIPADSQENIALLFQVLSLIQGERSLSASLRGCCFFPLLSHLYFFPNLLQDQPPSLSTPNSGIWLCLQSSCFAISPRVVGGFLLRLSRLLQPPTKLIKLGDFFQLDGCF